MADHQQPQRKTWRYWLTAGGFALGLFCLLLMLSSCGSRQRTVTDPFQRYRAAMKPQFESQLDELELAPRYDIDITFDPATSVLTGTANIAIFNPSVDPWRYLIFRLYPALPQYGGAITVQGIAVNGRSVPFVYEVGNTALRVNLSQPLEKDQRADVRITWKAEVPAWTDAAAVYALFGASQQITSLPLFYPALAVYVPGPTLGAGHWWLDSGTVRGDASFNLTSLFVVTATLPADQIPVTSGTLITSTLIGNNQARHVWVTGPSREFLLQMSPLFGSAHTEAYGTRVTSFWLPGDEAAGRAALTYAIAALRIYSDRFGPYPFRDLRIAPAPINYRGMEYPQAVLLGTQLYSRFRENLEVLVAHEVAHQWWYQVVHNDPVNEPWLDEALAEYSMKIYMEELRGRRDANALVHERWQIPLNGLQLRGLNMMVDQPVESFSDGLQYETIIYGKGALFYDALRETLGERQFFRFLQNYLDKHRYGIVDTDTWLADLAALNNPAVDALYQEWVARPVASVAEQSEDQSE
jgi:aminopeptidase N